MNKTEANKYIDTKGLEEYDQIPVEGEVYEESIEFFSPLNLSENNFLHQEEKKTNEIKDHNDDEKSSHKKNIFNCIFEKEERRESERKSKSK
jgi:hypothetical protein